MQRRGLKSDQQLNVFGWPKTQDTRSPINTLPGPYPALLASVSSKRYCEDSKDYNRGIFQHLMQESPALVIENQSMDKTWPSKVLWFFWGPGQQERSLTQYFRSSEKFRSVICQTFNVEAWFLDFSA